MENTPIANSQEPEEDEDDILKGLEDEAPKPHCMGHAFHWSEVAFFLFIITGFVVLALGKTVFSGGIPRTVAVILYLVAALTATSLIFNLITIKRIAAASELLLQDVKKFRAQNSRAKGLQEINKKNDAQMKNNLADLEKAGLLLKGSVQGLEDVQKEEEAMLQEREELLEKRREVAQRLETNMNKLWDLTIDSVRSELEKRVMNVFTDLAHDNPNDPDDQGVVVGGPAWDELISIIEEYGVAVDHNDTSEFGLKTVAGDDNFLGLEEFETWWSHAEEKHFTNLIIILKKNRDLEDRVRSLELGLPEKDMDESQKTDVLISV